MHLGRYSAALRNQLRALELFEATVGPEHESVAITLESIGSTQFFKGDYRAALDAYERARAIVVANSPSSGTLGSLENNIGEALVKLGRPAEALPRFRRSLELWTAALGDTNPDLVYPLTGIGEAQLALDDPAAARVTLSRARALERPGEGMAEQRARTSFGLARAMWRTGEQSPETLELARGALTVLHEGGGPQSLRDEIAAWIEHHAETPSPG